LGSAEVYLHPLVLMNVSDHVTRHKAMASMPSSSMTGPGNRVHGVLIGTFEGRRLDIHTSFELQTADNRGDGTAVIDDEFFQTRLQQYAEVFPNYELVGWYSVGREPCAEDYEKLRETFEVLNASPFLLLLDPEPPTVSQALPVKVYEKRSTPNADGTMGTSLVPVAIKIDMLEAERIALNHAAKDTTASESFQSDYATHLKGTTNAVLMLQSRIKVLDEFLGRVESGAIPRPHHMLRELKAMCRSMSATASPNFVRDLLEEKTDAQVVTNLATITKTAAQLADLIEAFGIGQEKKSHKRGWHA